MLQDPGSAPLRLHMDAFWISPYSFSVFVALKEKGLAFAISELALDKGEHRRSEFQDLGLTGKIPALQHGSLALAESSAIIEYLDEAFPAPQYPRLFPEAMPDRARARMVMSWIRCDLMPIRDERSASTMFYARAEKPLSRDGEKAVGKLLGVADRLIPDAATNLFGAWCVADADLTFMLQRLALNGHPVSPKIARYIDGQWSRSSVRAFVEKQRSPYKPY